MNRLSGFIVHSLLSSLSLSYCILPPSFLLFFYLSQPLTSPSVLDDLIWNGSPPGYGLRYGPSLHCPSTSRFPDPWNLPSIGSPLSWFIPHFFLIPVLESRTDNLDILVKCRDLPSMSSLSPPRVPLIADNMEMSDNLGYPWTFSPDNVDIRCIALRPLSCGSYWNYRCFILIYRASGVRSS